MDYQAIDSRRLRKKCRVDGALHLWPNIKPGQLHFLTFNNCWCSPDVIWDPDDSKDTGGAFIVKHHLETPMKRRARRRG